MSQLPRISVVDDDESVGEAIKSLLASLGFKVEVFNSAEAFLNSARLIDTACLIADVRMPGMSGLELQNFLNTARCWIPIVFISAHDDGEARSGALEAGAIDFLRKPFSEDSLLSAIKCALETRGDDTEDPDQDCFTELQ
ncbi:MAG: response regulator [Pyrinomonadaceae bacterium]|nr:response regulator [Pyrinomonadaceae bacterium]